MLIEDCAIYATAQINLFNFSQIADVLQFASISFDASISEIVMSSSVRELHRMFMGTREEFTTGQPLLRLLQKQGITHATLVPSALAVLSPQHFQL